MSLNPAPKKRSPIRLGHDEYKALCKRVESRDKFKCRVKGCKARSGLHVHHLRFRSQGGDDTEENLILVCHLCHRAIHNRYLFAFPHIDDGEFDAGIGVRWMPVNGWSPGKKT